MEKLQNVHTTINYTMIGNNATLWSYYWSRA